MKFGTVRAKIADDGEKIQTILKDGTNETSNVASGGDYIVTNPVSGESWIIDKDKFEKKYQKIEGKSDEYKPKGAPVKAIVVDKNVRFIASWGEEQRIGKGGYIIETKDGERYGNAKDEFESTYSRSEFSPKDTEKVLAYLDVYGVDDFINRLKIQVVSEIPITRIFDLDSLLDKIHDQDKDKMLSALAIVRDVLDSDKSAKVSEDEDITYADLQATNSLGKAMMMRIVNKRLN